MEISDRFKKLLDSLRKEIGAAKPGSDQGQFPILDLLGNLRDQTAGQPQLAEPHVECASAWDKLVGIVESGQPFTIDQIHWLNTVAARVEKLLAGESPCGVAATAAPAPAKAQAAAPMEMPAEEAELPLTLNIAEDGDLLREFINESREHLDNIEQSVLALETRPGDAEMLNTIFRAFHTFKGSAGFLNLVPINRLAHVLESLLDLARQKKMDINRPVIDLILRGRDVLKQFLDEIEGQFSGQRPAATILIPTAALKAEVQAIMNQGPCQKTPEPEITSSKPIPPCGPAETADVPAAAAPPEKAQTKATNVTAMSRSVEHTGTVKVETGKLDSLLDLVGEMVIAQSMVGQHLNQMANQDPLFARDMAHLGRITKDLQRISMSMRMMPIGSLFQKMARVVRDIGAKQGKKVQLTTSGEDTELDRGVVEELNDPLLHMIRNSMDHGIESADARIRSGKPAVGTIHLRACHQGGNIVIEVGDDGAGLNKERILAKAIERGLTSADARHSEEEIFGFIFAPGFSTAETVTDLSGRGVGLDVVNRNIEHLRGRVDIASTSGQGAVFKITLPLTLAIIDGLIVKVGEERYIIPTLSVRESFRARAEAITTVQGRAEVVNVRGRLIPLLRLHQLFGITDAIKDPTKGIVVVVQSGARYQCLLVDSLLHKQEVVIKNLNQMMIHKSKALAGAAILGDGRVGLILDVHGLGQQDRQPLSKAA
ncbi:MAG: chemotaxis protein CheA [Verrucomicrobiota bacterium]|jgi:two-component system chemotaxis sensor kinase CheA